MRMLDACDGGFGLGVMFAMTRAMSPFRALSSAAHLRRTDISATTESCSPGAFQFGGAPSLAE